MKSTLRPLRTAALVLCCAMVIPARPAGQPSTVLISVIDEISRRGLTNAEIVDLATGQHRFTDESLNGARVIRLEFSPSADVKGPDWSGAAMLDSATSYLRRVDFRAENLGRNYTIRRLEGCRTFVSPSPFVVMPDSSVAAWWKHEPSRNGEWGNPDIAQGLSLMTLEYGKATPPPHPAATEMSKPPI